MGADEVQIGAAQIGLEAEYQEWERGMNEVVAALDRGENALAEFTEKGESEGRKALDVQRRIDRALVELTGTTTEQQLAAIDRKYSRTLALARDSGRDITRLEAAIYQEKHAILQREDADYQRHVKEIAGSNVTLGESMKGSTRAFKDNAEAAERTGTHFRQTQGAVQKLGDAFGAQAGSAGKAASAMSSLLSVGLNPVALATAALALTIGAVIRKHEEQAEAAKKATEAYAAQRLEVFRYQAAMEALHAGTGDASVRAIEKELATREASLAVSKEQYQNDNYRGSIGDVIGRGHQAEMRALKEKNEIEEQALDGLRLRVAAARDEYDQTTRLNAEKEETQRIERENAEWYKKVDEIWKKKYEAEDRAFELEKKHAKERAKLLQQEADARYDAAERLGKLTLDLEIENNRRILEADEENYEVRAHLREMNERKELESLADKAVPILMKAIESGLALNAAEEQIQAAREAIVRKYADMRVEDEARAAGRIAAIQAATSGGYTDQEAKDVAHDLYAQGLTQAEIRSKLSDLGILEQSGFGSSGGGDFVRNGGLTPWEEHQRQITMAIQDAAFRAIAPFSAMSYGPGVNIQIANVSQSSSVHVEKPANAGDPVRIVVSDDVLNGGDIYRALRAAGFQVG